VTALKGLLEPHRNRARKRWNDVILGHCYLEQRGRPPSVASSRWMQDCR
jgi:hypothetical protein